MMTTNHFLHLSRLVVTKSGCSVYDEQYHVGVNIVRSTVNACGKSSIMDLISYALGSEVHKWTDQQKQCDYVYAEVIVNGKQFCFRREIQQDSIQPTYVSDLSYDNAIKSEKWIRFGHRRNAERHSFSQWLFNELNYPMHKIDADSNLTMHQLLRLMYFDQQTSDSDLLRPDSRFDNALTRQSIGDFLLGLDNLEYSRIKQEYLATVKKFEDVKHEVKSIYTVLGPRAQGMNKDSINSNVQALLGQIEKLHHDIEAVKNEDIDSLVLEQQQRVETLKRKISSLSRELTSLQEKCSATSIEIEDNNSFVGIMQQRIKSIGDSLAAREAIMSVSFEYCPLCLTPLDTDEDISKCPLCKHPCDDLDYHSHGHLRMAMEMEFQVKETLSVTERMHVELAFIKNSIISKSNELDLLSKEYHSIFESRSISESKLIELSRQIGVCEAKIEIENRNLELALRLTRLLERKDKFSELVGSLEDELQRLEASNFERKRFVVSSLERLTCDLVSHDTGIETNFVNPTTFKFDFSKNTFSINNAEKISESSNVILKSSFALAMLIESTRDELYRLPRFMILDQTEGQGMVLERRHRFQATIIEYCRHISGPFQLIFTTSSLDPEYEGSPLCVGPCYSGTMKTLNFSRC